MFAKAFNALKNNPKKSVFFGLAGAYGLYKGQEKYAEHLLRRELASKYVSFGRNNIADGVEAKKVIAILNTRAYSGKAKKFFEKNVAPMLHLNGLEVAVVNTDYEQEAKDLMSVVDMKTTEAVIVCGGDGTVQEVITGLMRRKTDEAAGYQFIPVGIVPLGHYNSCFKKLHSLTDDGETKTTQVLRQTSNLCDNIISKSLKAGNVMEITSDKSSKSVYSSSGLEIGYHKDLEVRLPKLWYMGGFKYYWIYVKYAISSALSNKKFQREVSAKYTLSCDGCSKCQKKQIPVSKKTNGGGFFNIFSQSKSPNPPEEVAVPILSSNSQCRVEFETDFTCPDVMVMLEDNAMYLCTSEKMGHSLAEFISSGRKRSTLQPYSKEMLDWYKQNGTVTKVASVQLTLKDPVISETVEHADDIFIDNEVFDGHVLSIAPKFNFINIFGHSVAGFFSSFIMSKDKSMLSRVITHTEISNRRMEENACWRQHRDKQSHREDERDSRNSRRSSSRGRNSSSHNYRSNRARGSRSRSRSNDRWVNRQKKIQTNQIKTDVWKNDLFEIMRSSKKTDDHLSDNSLEEIKKKKKAKKSKTKKVKKKKKSKNSDSEYEWKESSNV